MRKIMETRFENKFMFIIADKSLQEIAGLDIAVQNVL